MPNPQTDRQTDSQTDKQTDRKTESQADRVVADRVAADRVAAAPIMAPHGTSRHTCCKRWRHRRRVHRGVCGVWGVWGTAHSGIHDDTNALCREPALQKARTRTTQDPHRVRPCHRASSHTHTKTRMQVGVHMHPCMRKRRGAACQSPTSLVHGSVIPALVMRSRDRKGCSQQRGECAGEEGGKGGKRQGGSG